MNEALLTPKNLAILLDDLGDYSLERVTLVSRLVHSADAISLLDKWRAEDDQVKHPGGRPSTTTDHAVLVLLLLLALENRPLHIETMSRIVSRKFSSETMEFLGLADDNSATEAWYHRLLGGIQNVLTVVDPCPLKNRRKKMSREDYEEEDAARDPVETAIKHARLHLLMNAFREATWRGLPVEIQARWHGNTAVDGTLYSAFSKRPAYGSARMSIEPDAGHWQREGNHEVDGQTVTSKIKKFGWDTHIAVTIANDSIYAPDFPVIGIAVGFDKPGVSVAENTLALYQSLISRGHAPGGIVADLIYWAGQKVEKFHLPLTTLGYWPVTDYRTDQLGDKGGTQGALMVEGKFYCPHMKPDLINATKLFLQDGDVATWRARIAQREYWEAKPKGLPDVDGYQRLMHPVNKRGLPVCDPARKNADALQFCSQKSITVSPEASAKFRQPLRFGSEEWLRMYGYERNCIETYNAYIKDESKQAFGTSSRRRIKGYTAQAVMASLLMTAANIRKINAFYIDQEKAEQFALANPGSPRRKRRASSLQNWRSVPKSVDESVINQFHGENNEEGNTD